MNVEVIFLYEYHFKICGASIRDNVSVCAAFLTVYKAPDEDGNGLIENLFFSFLEDLDILYNPTDNIILSVKVKQSGKTYYIDKQGKLTKRNWVNMSLKNQFI